ncbi:aspartate aminotransferase family protein [Bacillus lacus]|uniref:Aspartate aminotransferase family protein n=1 Tax=Metabacillus lacus TaxID=1983721 RepID=A0A7X2LYZ0_9BACI|nr:aspartate aminotransferase family protein [Metabacillus lacus]MRX72876.1 aspartate aminotransferase family protein [Metabacillus lacus]
MPGSYLIKPVLDGSYKEISHGNGIYLYDSEGKAYIDGSSGAVTCSIGHGCKEVIEAMNEQAGKISFVYRSQFTNQPAEELADKLAAMAPEDLNWSFFVNSGSEAVETAVKIALQYWQEKGQGRKTHIISRWMSYHGITIGALSLSGHTERRRRFFSHLESSPAVSPPYCYRCPYQLSHPSCGLKCAEELQTAVDRTGKEHVAAFIAEPVIGAAGGAISPPEGYYQRIKEICNENAILFIADEVMTGAGRTGKAFAMEHWQTVPDISILGKGLSAGYSPIASVIVSDDILCTIKKGSNLIMSGHTYSANPQSAAAALAVLKVIEKENLIQHAEKIGILLMKKLQNLKEEFSMIGDVRGKGLLLGIEFVANSEISAKPFPKDYNITSLITRLAQDLGLLLYPSSAGIDGREGDAVLLAPPLNITEVEVNKLVSILHQTLKKAEEMLTVMGRGGPQHG